MPLYHYAARDAIISWQRRVGISFSSDEAWENPEQINANAEGRVIGIQLYDAVIKELIYESDADSTAIPLYQDKVLILTSVNNRIQGPVLSGPDSTDHTDPESQNPPSSIQPLPNPTNKHRVNQANLQRHWDVSQRTSREDWDDWMRRLAVQLLREAPAPALRATAGLAYAYQPLARELFSAAFVCCWPELNDQYRASLIHAMESAFFADVSPEILQTLLNLAEFMEHDGPDGLPIDIAVLAELALKCRSYAKALHYKEREYNLGGGGLVLKIL